VQDSLTYRETCSQRGTHADHRGDVACRRLERTTMEAEMSCRMCGGEERELYRVPVAMQLGSVPIYTACFFCYLKLTTTRPPRSEIVPGSGARSQF
jgi:hypothetical protein